MKKEKKKDKKKITLLTAKEEHGKDIVFFVLRGIGKRKQKIPKNQSITPGLGTKYLYKKKIIKINTAELV